MDNGGGHPVHCRIIPHSTSTVYFCLIGCVWKKEERRKKQEEWEKGKKEGSSSSPFFFKTLTYLVPSSQAPPYLCLPSFLHSFLLFFPFLFFIVTYSFPLHPFPLLSLFDSLTRYCTLTPTRTCTFLVALLHITSHISFLHFISHISSLTPHTTLALCH